MHATQQDVKTENQPVETHVQLATSKSAFNDTEYARWSEKLRNLRESKGK